MRLITIIAIQAISPIVVSGALSSCKYMLEDQPTVANTEEMADFPNITQRATCISNKLDQLMFLTLTI